jgi:copper chaperone CopZ
MIQTFKIEGMTCSSCVKTVSERLLAVPGIRSVAVSLANSAAEIEAERTLTSTDISQALVGLAKYKVSTSTLKPISKLKTYQPLITVIGFILLVSSAYQLSLPSFQSQLFMNHLMAGFFIGFSFFKFLNLRSFAISFSGYDPIAKRWNGYGYLYSALELSLGLLFLAGLFLSFANLLTILILSTTTIGVIQRIQSNTPFQCACLGTAFNLPLSWVTVSENLVMIGMAVLNLRQDFL